MDYEIYDKETVDSPFGAIKFSKFSSTFDDKIDLYIKNTSALEQISVESLLRIWKMIFRVYSVVKNDENLQSENILDYIRSEINYANLVWSYTNLEKRIFMCFRRLRNFILHINVYDIAEDRKNMLKQYVIRVIAIIFKYPTKITNQEAWSNRLKKLLRAVIHACDDKAITARISKGRSLIIDDSPNVDIDTLISQLPSSSSQQARRMSREKLSLTVQSLVKDTRSDKSIIKTGSNKSILNSIYKDSQQYRYIVSNTPTSPTYLDTVQISHAKKVTIVESLNDSERGKSGNWEENSIERKNTRNRTGMDKRSKITRNTRAYTKDYPGKESISEEPEEKKQESNEESEESDEASREESDQGDFEEDIISAQLQNLVNLNDIESDTENNVNFAKKKQNVGKVFGRNAMRK